MLYISIRSKTVEAYNDGMDGDQISLEERDALLLEHRTWHLIRAIYELVIYFVIIKDH